jgi:hypothetical protein
VIQSPSSPSSQVIRRAVNLGVRRLLNMFLIEPAHDLIHRLHWSGWRRRHQARAQRAHYTRRLDLALQP